MSRYIDWERIETDPESLDAYSAEELVEAGAGLKEVANAVYAKKKAVEGEIIRRVRLDEGTTLYGTGHTAEVSVPKTYDWDVLELEFMAGAEDFMGAAQSLEFEKCWTQLPPQPRHKVDTRKLNAFARKVGGDIGKAIEATRHIVEGAPTVKYERRVVPPSREGFDPETGELL